MQVRIRISSSTVNLQVYGPHAVDKIIWHRRAQLIPAFTCFIRNCACSCLVSTRSKLWRWQHLFCHQEWWIARVWSECCAVRFQFRLFNNLCLKFYTEKRTCSDFAWGMHKIKLASVWKHTAKKKKQRHALPNIDPESALHVRTKKCCSVFYTTKPYLQVRSRICSNTASYFESPFELSPSTP